jgi:hypothetical protein
MSNGSVKRLWLVLAAAMLAAPAASSPPPRIGPPPASLGLDSFYAKHLDAGGISIIGSAKVPDEALLIARDIVKAQLAHRPDLRRELVRQGTRVGIMAAEEAMTDLPEHRHWKKPAKDDPRLTKCEREGYAKIEALSDRDYWDRRARGSGGVFTTVGAETCSPFRAPVISGRTSWSTNSAMPSSAPSRRWTGLSTPGCGARTSGRGAQDFGRGNMPSHHRRILGRG